ncbi:hypothetical protein M422DRAFT_266852 [Sphaerobolus stellatus SS14]|uniref:Uncharacterized protein n=1 Tax=Sphaerobolus stellatus (strain SS14) TaxID=990650 RepID=A0A0C9V1Y2_SPHS4|nr:hypothetical protein M422DRAFT_266852 [Sphaerobolus stellatus SS14]
MLHIKFLHCKGILAVVLTNGHAGQALGLGDALMQLNDPTISGFNIREAADMVINILKTCSIHFKKNIQPLASVVSQADYDKISRFPYITTLEKLDEWHHVCSNHLEKKVRSTNLSLIEAIEGARELDQQIADKLDIADENGLSVWTKTLKAEKKLLKQTENVCERQVGTASKGKLVVPFVPQKGMDVSLAGMDLIAYTSVVTQIHDPSFMLTSGAGSSNLSTLGIQCLDPDLEPPMYLQSNPFFLSSTAPPSLQWDFNVM